LELTGTIIKSWFEPKESALLKLILELENKQLIELIDSGTFDELMNRYQLKVDGMNYIDLGIDGKKCLLSKTEDEYHFISYVDA